MKREEIEQDIMKIMKEKLVSHKSEIIKEISKNKKIPKVSFNKAVKKLVEKKWLISIYGSNSTFAITQKGLRESKK